MAGGKLPPRQKMIGMMYLVLTALLAMNVSKSILDAFININDGIQSTAVTIDANNGFVYQQFDKARSTGGENGKKWAEKSDKVKKMANDMFNHIEKLKVALVAAVEDVPENVADTLSLAGVSAKDNYDMPTLIMGLDEPSTPKSGENSGLDLRLALNKYQAGLTGIFEDKAVKDLIKNKIKYLDTPEIPNNDGVNAPWEVGMFYHIPLAAVVTLLSKTQSDVRSAESEVISKLYERIDAGGVSFNKVSGMALVPKAFLTPADSFSADIFTAAYDDRVNPEVFVFNGPNGGVDSALLASGETDIDKLMKGTKGSKWGENDWYQMSKEDVRNGQGKLKIKPKIGLQNWGGLIKLNTKKGPKIYDFTSSFEVGVPSFAVSADAMNVFYMGIDNPVSVSAPMPKFTASAPGLTKSGAGWIMRPTKPGNVSISVTGQDEVTGKSIAVGSVPFRVKRIPTPVAYIIGKTGTVLATKSKLMSGVVQAKLEGFVFDLKVRVSSFTLGTTVAGDYRKVDVKGNRMNSNCKNLIKRASKGQRFYLENMKVKMPDGRTVKLGNVTIKIN